MANPTADSLASDEPRYRFQAHSALQQDVYESLFSLDGPEWVVKPRCVSSSCSLFLREAGRYSARLLRLCTITVFIL
jgi:hypothetical protein